VRRPKQPDGERAAEEAGRGAQPQASG
jgi:hypothetical protein